MMSPTTATSRASASRYNHVTVPSYSTHGSGASPPVARNCSTNSVISSAVALCAARRSISARRSAKVGRNRTLVDIGPPSVIGDYVDNQVSLSWIPLTTIVRIPESWREVRGIIRSLHPFQLVLQRRLGCLRVRLPFRRFHHLADQKLDRRRLATPILGHGLGVRGDNLARQRRKRIPRADLRQPALGDDLPRRLAAAEAGLEDLLRGRPCDRALREQVVYLADIFGPEARLDARQILAGLVEQPE